ncbi:MAG: glycosyltransferase [Chitinispirillaceae bacterium]|nr:glycosyltransferase [Chitinispirillaceae bacterium]
MASDDKTAPRVSIIVISKDRHADLLKAVASLKLLRYPHDRYEIVVVEEGDEPAPPEGVTYVFLPRRDKGLGFARNTGVRNSLQSDIIAFTDDDCLADPQWLDLMVAQFEDPRIMGVAGSTFAQPGSDFGLSQDILGFPGGGHKRYYAAHGKVVETTLLSGCNCAYRRSVFDEVTFKEDSYGRLGADDFLMGITVARKWKCVYVPDAIVYHKPRSTAKEVVRWFTRRRINELLLICTGTKKNFSEFFKQPHKMVLLRALALALIAVNRHWGGPLAALLILVSWYAYMFFKYKPLTGYYSSKSLPYMVPVVRLLMDLGTLVAEWKFITKDINCLSMALSEYNRK